ncbi:MAG: hypothetical protein A3K22_01960 [Deltaproteobacteria bacterium RBG_16_42_7]|nr:MAG: hypothetical protein A3K22_01960 [Deltaproteobacteria bacterium RBG_16_42_7]
MAEALKEYNSIDEALNDLNQRLPRLQFDLDQTLERDYSSIDDALSDLNAPAQPEERVSVLPDMPKAIDKTQIPGISPSWPDVIKSGAIESFIPATKQAAAGLLQSAEEGGLSRSLQAGIRALPIVGPAVRMLEETILPTVNKAIGKNIALPEIIKPVYEKGRTLFTEEPEKSVLGEEIYKKAGEELEAIRPALEPGSAKQYVHDILVSFSQTAPSRIAGIATGNPAIALAPMGFQAFGHKYGQYREKGLQPDEAFEKALPTGISEALTEIIPFQRFIKKGVPLAKRIMSTVAADVPGELINTTVESIVDKTSISPEMSFKDYVQSLVDTAIITIGQTALTAGLAHPIVKLAERDEKKKQEAARPVRAINLLGGNEETLEFQRAKELQEKNPELSLKEARDITKQTEQEQLKALEENEQRTRQQALKPLVEQLQEKWKPGSTHLYKGPVTEPVQTEIREVPISQKPIKRQQAIAAENIPDVIPSEGKNIPAHIERALQEPRTVPVTVGVQTKQLTKDTLNEHFSKGTVKTSEPIRLTTVDELRSIVKNGVLREGEDFEGREGISAQITGKEKPIVAYGDNDKISAAVIFPEDAVTGKGQQPNEVKINANTPVNKLRFVIDGYKEILTLNDLKKIMEGKKEEVRLPSVKDQGTTEAQAEAGRERVEEVVPSGLQGKEKEVGEEVGGQAETLGTAEQIKPPISPKEPWEMTSDEWFNYKFNKLSKKTQGQIRSHEKGFVSIEKIRTQTNSEHNRNIQRAFSEGKLVPPEVLKDYPELAKKAEPERSIPSAERLKELNAEYVGMQERLKKPSVPLYTDLETKSSFVVPEGHTLEELLETTRERFRKPQMAIDMKAHEAATSPQNVLPEPTEAQKEAGNYQKGHIALEGKRFIGRVIPEKVLPQVIKNLGVTGKEITPQKAFNEIRKGNTVRLANGWRFNLVRVSNENRIEILGDLWAYQDELSQAGAFMEKVDYKQRWFIPNGTSGSAVIEKITKTKPITEITQGEDEISLQVSQPLFQKGKGTPTGWSSIEGGGWEPVRIKIPQAQLQNILMDVQRIAAPTSIISVKEKITIDPRRYALALQAWGKGDLSAPIMIKGSHRAVRISGQQLSSIIELSLSDMDMTTPYHEAFHSVQELLLSDKEHAILEARFPDKEGISSKERQAEAFANWVLGEKQVLPMTVKTAFQKVKDFFVRLGNALRGRGFQSAEDIFGKAGRGELKTEREDIEEDIVKPGEDETSLQIGLNHPDRIISSVRDQVNDFMKSDKSFNSWWHRTVGTQYHKAQVDPDFKKVYDKAQEFISDFSRIALDAEEQAPTLLSKVTRGRDLLKFGISKIHAEKVGKAVFTGTLSDTIYTDEQLADPKGQFKLIQKEIQYYREYRAAINRSIDDLAKSTITRLAMTEKVPVEWAKLNTDMSLEEFTKELYDEYFKGRRNDLKTDITDFEERLILLGQETMRDEEVAEEEKFVQGQLEKARKELQQLDMTIGNIYKTKARANRLKAQGYAPLMRFGKYSVYVHEKNAEGQEIQHYFGLYESQHEANEAARALKEEFPGASVVSHN